LNNNSVPYNPDEITRRMKIYSVLITLAATAVLSVLLFSGLLYKLHLENTLEYLGFTLVLLVLLSAVMLYALFAWRKLLQEPKYLVIVHLAIILTIVLCGLFERLVSPYARPFLLAVFLVSILAGTRLALFAGYLSNTILVIIYFISDSTINGLSNIAFLAMTLVLSTLAVLFSKKNRRRVDYLSIAFWISLIYTVFSLIFALIENSITDTDILLEILLFGMAFGFINVFLFVGLLPLFEAMFNVVTNFRLAELTDHDRPLLRRLRTEAPGTFNHSLILGNIAEACALAIGEDTYLARAAAYYHDIGKLKNPNYFVENQHDEENPHDELSPETSVSLIKKHIQNGVALAKENRLPPEVIDAICEHHGTLPIKVFYYKAQKYTDGVLDIAEYSYDGPRPRSKISAILMIADAAEAAIRSAKDATEEVKKKIIEDVIKERMDLGQFAECDITMRELECIKETILTTFAGVLHERIEYPTQTTVAR